MNETETIGQLVEMSIQAERMAETLYRRIAARFPDHPQVQQFWVSYAAEEDGHARWLEKLRERTNPERMNAPADPAIFEDARRAISVPLDRLLSSIRTLQDAFEIANELEHAETNTVFEFLISCFAEDAAAHTFLRTQLYKHISRLMVEFPRSLGTSTLRRTVFVGDRQ